MDSKSVVVKSKSSNSGISKERRERKREYTKCSSNADFPRHGLKKRGVYVEKRLTKVNLASDKKEDEIAKKSPPRPGKKKFLASVFTILSKSTTGTQYPETDDDADKSGHKQALRNKKVDGNKNKTGLKRNKQNEEDENETNQNFKSRVLRKKFVREDKKKMVVLQSRKEIAQTPSNYSDWSYKDASQRSNTSSYVIPDDANMEGDINIADDLKNAILEGRQGKKLRYLEDDAKTLVSEPAKDHKNLYNFFVDLLETTISVYNVAAEYDAAGPSDVSKTALQINESVANKLNIRKNKPDAQVTISDTNINSQETHYFHDDNHSEDGFMNMKPITIKISRHDMLKPGKIKKLKADSFIHTNKIKTLPKKSRSVDIHRKKMVRNKNDLINVLKQELEIDPSIFEEPRSIFQALSVMARNKKKRISFHPKTLTDECVLKRRKVISLRKAKKMKQKTTPFNDMLRPAKFMFDKDIFTTQRTKDDEVDSFDSYHSLEVYGMDYETKRPKTFHLKKPKDITLTYHSSQSQVDFDLNDIILNPAGQYSSIWKFT